MEVRVPEAEIVIDVRLSLEAERTRRFGAGTAATQNIVLVVRLVAEVVPVNTIAFPTDRP